RRAHRLRQLFRTDIPLEDHRQDRFQRDVAAASLGPLDRQSGPALRPRQFRSGAIPLQIVGAAQLKIRPPGEQRCCASGAPPQSRFTLSRKLREASAAEASVNNAEAIQTGPSMKIAIAPCPQLTATQPLKNRKGNENRTARTNAVLIQIPRRPQRARNS